MYIAAKAPGLKEYEITALMGLLDMRRINSSQKTWPNM